MSMSFEFVVIFVTAAVLFHHGSSLRAEADVQSEGELNGTNVEWPNNRPWTQLDMSNSRVLGEGTFGVATRFYTTCTPTANAVVKEVKQDRFSPMHERIDACNEAVIESYVQMQMSEYGFAPRIFDIFPKECNKRELQGDARVSILMNRAWGEISPHQDRKPDISLMLEVANQLFSGLFRLHKLGYLHRDIKPANTLFESDKRMEYWEDCLPGECRFSLSDYGLACKTQTKKSASTCDNFAGTPIFMSPEIVWAMQRGYRAVNIWSVGADYWALGVSLFEMWTGTRPGDLSSRFYDRNGLYKYIEDLEWGRNDWWLDNYWGRQLDEQARTSESHQRFKTLLSLLLTPEGEARVKAVRTQINSVFKKMEPIAITPVCIDPCSKCSANEKCRMNTNMAWACEGATVGAKVGPPIQISLAVLDDSAIDRVFPFTVPNTAAGFPEVRDLKDVLAQSLGMNVDDGVFYLFGHNTPLSDHTRLQTGHKIQFSLPLREALLGTGSLSVSIKETRDSVNAGKIDASVVPYLDAAAALRQAWPSSQFAGRADALQSKDNKAKVELASTMKPFVLDVQAHMKTALTMWHDWLADLVRPHEELMNLEYQANIADTRARCDALGLPHCAREVRMAMNEPVDYVKVLFQMPGEGVETKLKFFANGTVMQTRGNKASDLKLPTLPGNTSIHITLCKNMKDENNMKDQINLIDKLKTKVKNKLVKSQSRCGAVGTPIDYKLLQNGWNFFHQMDVGGRKQMQFTVSAEPLVSFFIWEGDYILPQ